MLNRVSKLCIPPALTITLILGAAFALPGNTIAQVVSPTPHASAAVTFDINYFVTMLKWVFGLAAVLLITFAGMCVTFFGFSIKDARNTLENKATQLGNVIDEARRIRDDARNEQDRMREKLTAIQKECNDIFDKLKSEYRDQQNLMKNNQYELDNMLRNARDLIDKLSSETREANNAGSLLEELQEPAINLSQSTASHESVTLTSDDAKRNRIREIIRTSKFEWTTIGRVMKGTGLTHGEIIELIQSMQDIKIGRGKKTQNVIFRFE